jgi:hypothetical protein
MQVGQLQSHVLCGEWDAANACLESLGLSGEQVLQARFLLLERKVLEVRGWQGERVSVCVCP